MTIETQKYGGAWKLYKKEKLYEGELHLNCDKRIIALELLLPASEDKPRPRSPYKGKIPYICGTLFSGAKILLYDCLTGQEHMHVMSHTQQIIYAKYAFWGLAVTCEEEIKFTKAIFDFGEIIEWSGLCHYKWDFTDDGNSNLMWFHQDPVTFELSENLKISFTPNQGTISGDRYSKEIKANQYIWVEFAYINPTTWELIMEDVLCIQYLIGLGVNQKVEINKAQFYHPSIYSEYPNEDGNAGRIHSPVDMIMGTGTIKATAKTMSFYHLYSLDCIRNSVAFSRWRDNYSRLKPVLDLYFTAFTEPALTHEMLFLNLVQALETYHSRFITDDIREYKKRVEELVVSFCKGNSNTEQWKNYLLDAGQKNSNKSSNRIYLRSRLADLIFANGQLPFEPRGLRRDKYTQKIVDTRNYYTHYNPVLIEKAFTKAELPWVNGHLIALIVCLASRNYIVRQLKNT